MKLLNTLLSTLSMVSLAFLLLIPTAIAVEQQKLELKEGRLYVDGEWQFLKIAKPLRHYGDPNSVDKLIEALPILQAKDYNCLELVCYWHHFDPDGDGAPEVSLAPLIKLLTAMEARGIYVCITTETYGVGGGTVPAGFWERHPEAIAINSKGEKVKDNEYGFGTAVPSLFAPAYLNASRSYVKNLLKGLPLEKVLYYETTVEPQFIGNQALDFSDYAKRAYETWVVMNKLDAPAWPAAFPVEAAFLEDPVWKRFKAESLAAWVNGDAAAYRAVAGEKAWIAVDYLETGGKEMPNRNGDSLIFLRNLTCANIIQVNWHWHLGTRAPNQIAYDNVRKVMAETGRDWAITEHMTFNGSDYSPEEAPAMLRNTLQQGTRFGWEFVSVGASSGSAFSMYEDDWSPKPLIAVVDDHWASWEKEIRDK